jgi:hypothetical protein
MVGSGLGQIYGLVFLLMLLFVHSLWRCFESRYLGLGTCERVRSTAAQVVVVIESR